MKYGVFTYQANLSSTKPNVKYLDDFFNKLEDDQVNFLKENFDWQILINLYKHNQNKLIDLLSRHPVLFSYAKNKKLPNESANKDIILEIIIDFYEYGEVASEVDKYEWFRPLINNLIQSHQKKSQLFKKAKRNEIFIKKYFFNNDSKEQGNSNTDINIKDMLEGGEQYPNLNYIRKIIRLINGEQLTLGKLTIKDVFGSNTRPKRISEIDENTLLKVALQKVCLSNLSSDLDVVENIKDIASPEDLLSSTLLEYCKDIIKGLLNIYLLDKIKEFIEYLSSENNENLLSIKNFYLSLVVEYKTKNISKVVNKMLNLVDLVEQLYTPVELKSDAVINELKKTCGVLPLEAENYAAIIKMQEALPVAERAYDINELKIKQFISYIEKRNYADAKKIAKVLSSDKNTFSDAEFKSAFITAALILVEKLCQKTDSNDWKMALDLIQKHTELTDFETKFYEARISAFLEVGQYGELAAWINPKFNNPVKDSIKDAVKRIGELLKEKNEYIKLIAFQEKLADVLRCYDIVLLKNDYAKWLLRNKKYKEAIIVLRELGPSQRLYEIKGLHKLIIENYLQINDAEQALKYFGEVNQEEVPYTANEMDEKYVNCLLKKKEYRTAIEYCNSYCSRNPELKNKLFRVYCLFVTNTLGNSTEYDECLKNAEVLANEFSIKNTQDASYLYALIENEKGEYDKAYACYLKTMSSKNNDVVEAARIGLAELFFIDKIKFCKQPNGTWQLEINNMETSLKEGITLEEKKLQKKDRVSRAIQAYGFIMQAQSSEGLKLKSQIIATILGKSMDSNPTDNDLYEQMDFSCYLECTEFYGNFTDIPYSQEIYQTALIKLPAKIKNKECEYDKAYACYLKAMSSKNNDVVEAARIGLAELFFTDKIKFCKQPNGTWQLEINNMEASLKKGMIVAEEKQQIKDKISRAIQAYGFIMQAQSSEGLKLKSQIIATILGKSMNSYLTDNSLYTEMDFSCCLEFTEFYGNFTNIPYSQAIYHKALINLSAKQQDEITRLSAENKSLKAENNSLKEDAIKSQETNKTLLAKLEKLTNNNPDIAWKPQVSKTFRNSL